MSALKMTRNFEENCQENYIIRMSSWMRNQLTILYKVVSAPVAATRDALEDCRAYVKLVLYCITG